MRRRTCRGARSSSRSSAKRARFDVGRCAQNMMLAAWGDGVVSCPNGITDPTPRRRSAAAKCERSSRSAIPRSRATRRAAARRSGRRGRTASRSTSSSAKSASRPTLPSNSLLQGWTVGRSGHVGAPTSKAAETLSNSLLLGRTWRLRTAGGRAVEGVEQAASRRRRTRSAPSPAAGPQLQHPAVGAGEAAGRRVPVRRPADRDPIRPAARDADDEPRLAQREHRGRPGPVTIGCGRGTA